jgi:predicted pyridoxine 5'-phosphate oxidase superfamily flavin-nucleotide-binding protein
MGNVHESITDDLKAFAESQPVFFVATAPTTGGHVNVSPKGLEPVVVLGPHEVAYIERNGSGIETVAHLRDNGRITVMFCAFKGKPNIVRFGGTGEVVWPDDPRFADLAQHFPDTLAVRSIIRIDVDRVSDSCGYGVPLMEFKGDRRALDGWAKNKTEQDLHDYQQQKNLTSIDGLPGVRAS